MLKRFYLVELKKKLPVGFYEAKLFLTRNYIIFDSLSETKGTSEAFLLLDFGKEIDVDRTFQFLDNLFKPVSITWLDRGELRTVIDFCYLYSDREHLFTKGDFLNCYLNNESEEL